MPWKPCEKWRRARCKRASPARRTFALRDYGTGQWDGGEAGCDHKQSNYDRGERADRDHEGRTTPYRDLCGKCGARRVDRQLGLEDTPDAYVARLVEVFREVRRVLRDDGTIWVNLGDSYSAGGANGHSEPSATFHGHKGRERDHKAKKPPPGLKPKDLLGMPWRVAFALQADGWILRADCIWHKPNPMPESVTDRPTKSHEYLFLMAKQATYYYDAEAVRESVSESTFKRWGDDPYSRRRPNGMPTYAHIGGENTCGVNPAGRNRRSVWTLATHPYAGAHFATFPPALVEPCVLAGTSERGGCPACGAPWVREVERIEGYQPKDRPGARALADTGATTNGTGKSTLGISGWHGGWQEQGTKTHTTGWRPSCTCPAADPVPCVVLDPFAGACTSGLVALRLGRRFVGIELSPDYLALGRKRLRWVQPDTPLFDGLPEAAPEAAALDLFAEEDFV